MILYDATIPVFTKLLNGVNGWLDKASAYADGKKFDVQVLMAARLAPDQYPFIGQVQGACDQAKFTVRTTSESVAQRTMSAGRLSIIAFQIVRAAS